jgi:hypothetical protein
MDLATATRERWDAHVRLAKKDGFLPPNVAADYECRL